MSGDGGFTLTGSETLLDAGYLHIERRTYRAPDGSDFGRDVLVHPGAVAVVPWTGSEVLLIRQFRAPVGATLLEIPAGTLDRPGEDHAHAAHRELIEEVGMAPGALAEIARFYTAPGFCDEFMVVYLATGLTAAPAKPDGAEEVHAEVVALPIDAALAAIDRGEIIDAKSIIGLRAAAIRLP